MREVAQSRGKVKRACPSCGGKVLAFGQLVDEWRRLRATPPPSAPATTGSAWRTEAPTLDEIERVGWWWLRFEGEDPIAVEVWPDEDGARGYRPRCMVEHVPVWVGEIRGAEWAPCLPPSSAPPGSAFLPNVTPDCAPTCAAWRAEACDCGKGSAPATVRVSEGVVVTPHHDQGAVLSLDAVHCWYVPLPDEAQEGQRVRMSVEVVRPAGKDSVR